MLTTLIRKNIESKLKLYVTFKVPDKEVLHLGVLNSKKLERETRFELATSTLARLRSTS